MKVRYMLISVGLFLLIMLLSCNGLTDQKPIVSIPNPTSNNSQETPKDTSNQKWVILNEMPAESEEIASLLFESDGYWTPSLDDIQIIEEKIVDYLSQNSNEFYWQPPVWQRLDEYDRQYIGLERGGRKIIFGNYFCESGNQDWKKELVFVIDGGECYFQVEYDLESGFFIKLQVNGES